MHIPMLAFGSMLLFFVEQAIWGMSVLARYSTNALLPSKSVSDRRLLRCISALPNVSSMVHP